MTERQYRIGDRVLASVNGTGVPRFGVVTAAWEASNSLLIWNTAARYMVKFDHDDGPSGPCVIFRAVDGREAVSPLSGTAA